MHSSGNGRLQCDNFDALLSAHTACTSALSAALPKPRRTSPKPCDASTSHDLCIAQFLTPLLHTSQSQPASKQPLPPIPCPSSLTACHEVNGRHRAKNADCEVRLFAAHNCWARIISRETSQAHPH